MSSTRFARRERGVLAKRPATMPWRCWTVGGTSARTSRTTCRSWSAGSCEPGALRRPPPYALALIDARARGPRRRRPLARARRAVRVDAARRLRRPDPEARTPGRRDLAPLGAAVLWRRVRLLREPQPQQAERGCRPAPSRGSRARAALDRGRGRRAREPARRRGGEARARLRARARAAAADRVLLDLGLWPGRPVSRSGRARPGGPSRERPDQRDGRSG